MPILAEEKEETDQPNLIGLSVLVSAIPLLKPCSLICGGVVVSPPHPYLDIL